MSHNFGPKNDKDSALYLTMLPFFFLGYYFYENYIFNGRVQTLHLYNITGEYPCKTLQISVASALKFLWCIITELFLTSSF